MLLTMWRFFQENFLLTRTLILLLVVQLFGAPDLRVVNPTAFEFTSLTLFSLPTLAAVPRCTGVGFHSQP